MAGQTLGDLNGDFRAALAILFARNVDGVCGALNVPPPAGGPYERASVLVEFLAEKRVPLCRVAVCVHAVFPDALNVHTPIGVVLYDAWCKINE